MTTWALSDHSHDGQAESSSRTDSRTSEPRVSQSSSNRGPFTRGTTSSPGTSNLKSRLTGSLGSRKRESGGFLLGSSFSGKKEHDKRRSRTSDKGKGRSYLDSSSARTGTPGRDSTPSANADSPSNDGSEPRSNEYTRRYGSASPNEIQLDGENSYGTPERPLTAQNMSVSPQTPKSLALDPSQLVQMALALSEGRRRYASAGLQTQPSNADSRRVRSAGAPLPNFLPGSPVANEQSHAAPVTKNVNSPVPTFTFSEAEAAFGDAADFAPDNSQEADDEQFQAYNFSPSTLARAERARAFFELANAHRRLLQCLPPLNPSPRSSVGTFEATREYNPLQLLRNRKLRTRERRHMVPSPNAFENVETVLNWIEEVEDRADTLDRTSGLEFDEIPPFDSGDQSRNVSGGQPASGHRRTDTASSRIEWTGSGWAFTPMELLADCIWSEKPDHKILLENGQGLSLVPTMNRRVRRSISGHEKDGSPGGLDRSATASTEVTDDDAPLRKSRRKRKFLSIHKVEDDVRKRLLRRRRSISSASASEISDSGNRDRSPVMSNRMGENIGPLARHMQERMAREDSEASPQLLSPDKWDHLPNADENASANRALTGKNVNDTDDRRLRPLPLDLKTSTLNKRQNGRSTEPSSAQDFDSPVPNSPAIRTAVPLFGMKLSPESREPSSSNQSSHDLMDNPSRESCERLPQVDTTDFALAGNGSSLPQSATSDITNGFVRRSLDDAKRPSLVRHNTTSSLGDRSVSDSKVARSAPPKGPTRGVSKIFKGGRIGNMVRHESTRFGDRIRRKEPNMTVSDMSPELSEHDSEMDDDDDTISQTLSRAPTASSTSQKPKYHIGLPSFRSNNASKTTLNGEETSDPISRQQSLQRAAIKGSRQSKLALPKITVPGLERTRSSASMKTVNSDGVLLDDRQGKGNGFLTLPKRGWSSKNASTTSLGEPGTIRHATPNRVPRSGLANVSVNREGSPGKRHWSIADQSQRHNDAGQRVSRKDVARVRALFISSGVKAHALCTRAASVSDPMPGFVKAAVDISGEEVGQVCHSEEFVAATKLWTKVIQASLKSSQKEVDTFREGQGAEARHRIEELRQKCGEQMTMTVQDATDGADAFTYDLNTHQTLAVKQVNDAIDEMVRRRRRNLRIVKRVGFTLLEWLVLSVMWGLWFVVVVFKVFQNSILRVARGVKWVLWP
ncbi:hypothetical protein MBLNU457_4677t2 [Dothideomycetes sp. NU457]